MAVILNTSKISIIKLFSINENNLYLVFEKQFDFQINIIRKINNNSIGVVFENYFEIYSSLDNFEKNFKKKENLSMFEIKKKINTPGIIIDFYKTSDDLYIIIACFTQINIYIKLMILVFSKK